MSRRAAAIPLGLAAALALAACAAPRTALIPAPPSEVRTEAGAPSAAAADRRAAPAPQAGEAREGPGSAVGGSGAPAAGKPAPAAPVPRPADRLVEYAAAYDRTRAAIERGAAPEAAPAWRALEDSKWGTDAVFNQGVLFQLGGDLEAAEAQYVRAAERSPAFEPPLANLLGIHLLRGDRERMKSLLARVVPPGAPAQPPPLPELAVNAAAALMETGRANDAALLLRALRSRGKTTPALPWNLAVLSYRDGNTAAARELATTAPAGVMNLYPVVASRFAWAGDGEKVPPLGPAPPGMPAMAALSANLKAYAEYRGGSVEAAEKTLVPAAAAGSLASAEILTNIGLLQAEQGRWREARENLERAVLENPALPAAWLNLGLFREVYEGNLAKSRECYENYVKLNGSRKEEVRKWAERLGQSASPQP